MGISIGIRIGTPKAFVPPPPPPEPPPLPPGPPEMSVSLNETSVKTTRRRRTTSI